ncbi:MAG: GNAT family N-acetyltransferase [Gemmatimonadaceae bacterium]|nr:GNAT family N-acetyltransferase [Gemmatimonadaceae bacterium]
MLAIEDVITESDMVDVRGLIRAHVEAHSEAHSVESVAALIAALPAPYTPPLGGLWIAREDSEAAGCAALQPILPGTGEVKRMYVRPEFRKRGIARALAQHVIAEARERGYTKLRLGTLKSMVPAQQLYTSLGFRPVPAYRPIEFGDTLFYELSLDK